MKPIKMLTAMLAFVFMAALTACGNSDAPAASVSQPAPSVPGSIPVSASQAAPPPDETPSAPADESEPYVFTGETSVEIDGRSFTLEDTPENTAEDVVVRDFLYTITQEFDAMYAISPDTEVTTINIENTKESTAAGKYIQSYVIHDILTLTEEQYAQEPAPDTDDPTLYYAGWERTVEEYGLQEFEIVHVTFTSTYSPAMNAAGPQWSEGRHARSFIVGKAAGDAAHLLYDYGMMQ